MLLLRLVKGRVGRESLENFGVERIVGGVTCVASHALLMQVEIGDGILLPPYRVRSNDAKAQAGREGGKEGWWEREVGGEERGRAPIHPNISP